MCDVIGILVGTIVSFISLYYTIFKPMQQVWILSNLAKLMNETKEAQNKKGGALWNL